MIERAQRPRRESLDRWKGVLVLVLGLVLVGARPSQAQETFDDVEQEYLDALRSRGLNRLLETYCKTLLDQRDLDRTLRARLTIELAGVLSDRANRNLDAAMRDKLWQEADERVQAFFANESKLGTLPLLKYQWAGQLLARSQIMFDLSKVSRDDRRPAESALRWANQAIAVLEQVSKAVDVLIRGRKPGGAGNRETLSHSQLTSLSSACEFRLGSAWLAAARVETNAARRTEALDQCQRYLSRFAQEFGVAPITLESHLALAEAYAMLDKPEEAKKLLDRLQAPEAPRGYKTRAILEAAKLHLKNKQVLEALKLLQSREEGQPAPAEWELLTAEALLRRAAEIRSTRPEDARKQEQQAVALIDGLEKRFGGYWGRRGEQTLAQFFQREGVSDNPVLLIRLGNVLRTEKRYADAIQSYDQALETARNLSQGEYAGRAAYLSAATLLDAGETAKAAERFERVAADYPDHETAPAALLGAATAWARIYGKNKQAETLAHYRRVLEKVVASYPEGTAAGEANFLLGELEERERHPVKAARRYQLVPNTSRRFAASVEALAGLYHDYFLTPSAKPSGDAALSPAEAMNVLQRILAAGEPSSASGDSSNAAAVRPQALAVARLVLARLLLMGETGSAADVQNQCARAAELLRMLVTDHSALPTNLKGRAWQALLEAELRRGKTAEAAAIAAQGFTGAEPLLVRSLNRLDPMSETLSDNERQGQIAVIEAASKRLLAHPDSVPPVEQRNLRLRLAYTYVAKKDFETAQRLFNRLVAEDNRDPRPLEGLASCLSASGRYKESLVLWSKLAQGYPRGGDRWINAVYQAILCHENLRQITRARDLLETTEKLYPELGGPSLKPKFDAVKQRLDRILSPSAAAPPT